MSSKEFDLVLLGPTGYTGKYVAEHIYKSFPTTLKWAVAGRSAAKIEGVLEELKQLGIEREAPGAYYHNFLCCYCYLYSGLS